MVGGAGKTLIQRYRIQDVHENRKYFIKYYVVCPDPRSNCLRSGRYFVQIQYRMVRKRILGCNSVKKIVFFKKKVATLSMKITVHLILRISVGFRMS